MAHGVTAAHWAQRLGIAAIVGSIAGPLLAHFALLAPMGGFLLFDLGGLLGIAAVIVGVVAAARGGAGLARSGLASGGLVSVVFLAAALPAGRFPPINDISTDTAQPPEFVTAGTLAANRGRDLRYAGAALAERQRASYPDLGPLFLPVPPDDAFRRVEAAARNMPDWEITRDDPGRHALEGVATSRLFRFRDDFVIEVRPQDSGSAVHMRSKSRDGKGDIGANAARIRAFWARLR